MATIKKTANATQGCRAIKRACAGRDTLATIELDER